MSNGRNRIIEAHLDQTTEEYISTKDRHEEVQAELEAAREKFISLRRLASEVLSAREWADWQMKHEGIKLVGMPIGDAIIDVLRSHAYDDAYQVVTRKKKTFGPAMNLDALESALTAGGFEFQSATPKRELNGALLKLDGVTKNPSGYYHVNDAGEILKNAKEWWGPTPAPGPKPEPEPVNDDVPL